MLKTHNINIHTKEEWEYVENFNPYYSSFNISGVSFLRQKYKNKCTCHFMKILEPALSVE